MRGPYTPKNIDDEILPLNRLLRNCGAFTNSWRVFDHWPSTAVVCGAVASHEYLVRHASVRADRCVSMLADIRTYILRCALTQGWREGNRKVVCAWNRLAITSDHATINQTSACANTLVAWQTIWRTYISRLGRRASGARFSRSVSNSALGGEHP